MKRLFCLPLVLSFMGMIALVFAHETTGWKTPEDTRKLKNPIKAASASIQKGKDVYEKHCARCHGTKGDGKGPESARLNPKATNFKESHGERMTDGELFWKITTGRGSMPSFEKDLTVEERWHVINYFSAFTKHK